MRFVNIILSVVLVSGLAGFFSCGGGNGNGGELTPQQEQAAKLQGSWTVTNVTTAPTGVSTGDLENLSITFNIDDNKTPTTFSSSGANDFFLSQSASGWEFNGTSTVIINLLNVTPVTGLSVVGEITETSLTLAFTHPGLRMEGLDGEYEIVLSK
jgi:hypothetical protein